MKQRGFFNKTENQNFSLGLVIGLGFLWSGMAYMAQTYRLMNFIVGNAVNLIVCGFYYVLQAVGLGIVSYLYYKHSEKFDENIPPVFISFFMLIFLALSIFSDNITAIIVAGAFLNLLIGMLSGCFLTRLSTNIKQHHRGIVFGGAYAFGSIGTWILSLPMEGKILWHSNGFWMIAALAFICIYVFLQLPPIEIPQLKGSLKQAGYSNKLIWLALAVVFLLSLENTLGFSFPLSASLNQVSFEFTRAFYAVGLIIAGLLSDKNRRYGAISTLAELAFPFVALALGSNMAAETITWLLAYVFLGFLSVYRILVFSDISGKTNLPALAMLGLLMGRLGEAAGNLGAAYLEHIYLIIVAAIVFILVVILFFYLYQKLYTIGLTYKEVEDFRFDNFAAQYRLTNREREIFILLSQGMSNAEIAGELYITESTVKFHIGNIFKKTGNSSRSELIADFRLSKY